LVFLADEFDSRENKPVRAGGTHVGRVDVAYFERLCEDSLARRGRAEGEK
jgi:hypothetical protein